MNIGTINTEETGLANGHPAVIIAGKIKTGTVCKVNGLLSLDETTGEFEVYASGAACIALEPITEETTSAKVMLHGVFDGSAVVKTNGNALTIAELAAVQKQSHIYFI